MLYYLQKYLFYQLKQNTRQFNVDKKKRIESRKAVEYGGIS